MSKLGSSNNFAAMFNSVLIKQDLPLFPKATFKEPLSAGQFNKELQAVYFFAKYLQCALNV